jgi:hypothetical protein
MLKVKVISSPEGGKEGSATLYYLHTDEDIEATSPHYRHISVIHQVDTDPTLESSITNHLLHQNCLLDRQGQGIDLCTERTGGLTAYQNTIHHGCKTHVPL